MYHSTYDALSVIFTNMPLIHSKSFRSLTRSFNTRPIHSTATHPSVTTKMLPKSPDQTGCKFRKRDRLRAFFTYYFRDPDTSTLVSAKSQKPQDASSSYVSSSCITSSNTVLYSIERPDSSSCARSPKDYINTSRSPSPHSTTSPQSLQDHFTCIKGLRSLHLKQQVGSLRLQEFLRLPEGTPTPSSFLTSRKPVLPAFGNTLTPEQTQSTNPTPHHRNSERAQMVRHRVSRRHWQSLRPKISKSLDYGCNPEMSNYPFRPSIRPFHTFGSIHTFFRSFKSLLSHKSRSSNYHSFNGT